MFLYLLTTSSSDRSFAICSGFSGPVGLCETDLVVLLCVEVVFEDLLL